MEIDSQTRIGSIIVSDAGSEIQKAGKPAFQFLLDVTTVACLRHYGELSKVSYYQFRFHESQANP